MHDESAVADHAPAPNFYASVLDEAELAEASATAGVDSELAMMRVQLRRRLRDQPDEYALLLKSIELIVRTVAARYRMSAKRSGEFSDTMGLAVKYVGEQLFPERFADV